MEILENIRVSLNLEVVSRKLHMKRESDLRKLRHLVDTVQQLIEPKAAYNVCYVDEKLEDGVIAAGLRLSSRVLRKNLDRVERFFPYVITLGGELSEEDRQCAWELYTELSTRVAVTGKPGDPECQDFSGELYIESFQSLYSFFQEAIEITEKS